MKRALFLDRDGVIIEDVGYAFELRDMHLLRDTVEVMVEARARGFLLVVLTNQSGIARGFFTIEQYRRFQTELDGQLDRYGVKPDRTYFCPYHPEGVVVEYSRHSECRKPRPGMVRRAIQDLRIDIARSYMMGDKDSDVIEFPKLRSVLVRGKYPLTRDVPIYDSVRDAWTAICNMMET